MATCHGGPTRVISPYRAPPLTTSAGFMLCIEPDTLLFNLLLDPSRPPLPPELPAAMNAIRSALARARSAPKPRPPRARHYAAVGGTQPERVAAEMVRYALGGAGRQSPPGPPPSTPPVAPLRVRF
jgi:hypothetical protein